MTLFHILLFLHIAAAGTWLGANMVQVAVSRMGQSEGNAFVAGWLRVAARLGGRLYMPVGILVLASGVGLVLEGAYEFEDLFVGIGVVVVIIGAVLGPAVLTPTGHKAADAVESGDQADVRSATARLTRFGVIDTLLVLFAMFAMVAKLGA